MVIFWRLKRRKFYVSKNAVCDSRDVGEGTRIWSFAHVLKGAKIGRDCNICESVFIENDVLIGHRVTIKNGVQIWDGITIEDESFIGPNVTFANDRYPRSKNTEYHLERTVVKKGASIGANATILPGLIIGESAMVGAGSVITKNVEPFTVVVGNPARVIRTLN